MFARYSRHIATASANKLLRVTLSSNADSYNIVGQYCCNGFISQSKVEAG